MNYLQLTHATDLWWQGGISAESRASRKGHHTPHQPQRGERDAA